MNKAHKITFTAMLAAMYAATVFALAPISFGMVQLRAAGMLQGLALVRPEFAVALGIGNFIANQVSPFGIYDWAIMPFFTWAAAHLAWRLRRLPPLALVTQSLLIAIGVATFPLGLGAGLPWLFSFVSVFGSMLIITTLGYIVLAPAWRYVEQIVVSG